MAAAEQLRAIAADRAARLRPDDPDTLPAQHDQARFLGESGRVAQAARILRHVGDRRATHAKFLAAASEPQQAAALLTETRRLCVDALGDQHPLNQFAEHLLRTASR